MILSLDTLMHLNKTTSSVLVEETMHAAHEAAATYGATTGEKRATLLTTIAENIESLDGLIETACEESGLPEARMLGERGRTVNQLRQFAALVGNGSWVDACIDRANPGRQPMPKKDIRKMLVALGPVVVFGASNFPLAFSTAGGDTASALAAGCPVVLKAHPSHPRTSDLVAGAIQRAVAQCQLPAGVFAHLHDTGYEVGTALVHHHHTKAVAFTGSLKGGRALFDVAQQRSNPIPVFAEMGSINPVLVLPDALNNNTWAEKYAASVTMGVGQFCTNPGLLIGIAGEPLEQFREALTAAMAKVAPATMLNEAICDNYHQRLAALQQKATMHLLPTPNKKQAAPAFASINASTFLNAPTLHEEVFGPFTLLVTCANQVEMQQVVEALEGQLTATVLGSNQALNHHEAVIATLQQKVGRIIFNDIPTGVEVCPAMHHGGPYPATTDSRFTSVGTDAIQRFVRPICFQNWPEHLLPPALQNANPLRLWRTVDGQLTRAAW